jgi:hypothetical protein
MAITYMEIVENNGDIVALLTTSLRKGLHILNQDETKESVRIFLHFVVEVTLCTYFTFQQYVELISSLCVNVWGVDFPAILSPFLCSSHCRATRKGLGWQWQWRSKWSSILPSVSQELHACLVPPASHG